MESSFIEIAKYAGQIGLVLFVLFALVKGLLALKIFTPIASQHTYMLLNKLINVVLIISLAAMLSGLVTKCNPSIGSLSGQTDNNSYTITFEEIDIMYMGIGLPPEMNNYYICFEARSGNDIIKKEVDKPLSSFVSKWSPPIPISLRGLQIKNVKGVDGCTLRVGFDPKMAKACAENADLVFKSEIGENEFNFANHLNTSPPVRMEMDNFILNVRYKITKQSE